MHTLLMMLALPAVAGTTDFHGYVVYTAEHDEHDAADGDRWMAFPAGEDEARTALTNAVVEIWDRDGGSSSNDDFLGYAVTDTAGHFHFQFDWDADYPQYSEWRPDLYIKVRFIGDVTDGWDATRIWRPGDSYTRTWEVYNPPDVPVVVSFRDDVRWNVGEGAWFLDGNHLGVTHLVDLGDSRIREVANLHQATDWVFERTDTSTYDMLDEMRGCETTESCVFDHLRIQTGPGWNTWAPGRSQTNIDSDRYRDIDMLVHEVSHRWQYMAFEGDGDHPGLVFDLGLNGGGHGGGQTSAGEWESAVLFEGAASFFGMSVRHWFSHADPMYYSTARYERDDCETFRTSNPPRQREYWTVASLWDLTDSRRWRDSSGVREDDRVDMSGKSVWEAFDQFPSCSEQFGCFGSHETREMGANQPNIYDFWFNWDDRWSSSSSERVQTALIDNNCMEDTTEPFRPF